jgi:hypothetical protein
MLWWHYVQNDNQGLVWEKNYIVRILMKKECYQFKIKILDAEL